MIEKKSENPLESLFKPMWGIVEGAVVLEAVCSGLETDKLLKAHESIVSHRDRLYKENQLEAEESLGKNEIPAIILRRGVQVMDDCLIVIEAEIAKQLNN